MVDILVGKHQVEIDVTDYPFFGKPRRVTDINLTVHEDGSVTIPHRARGFSGIVGSGYKPEVVIREAENGHVEVVTRSILGETNAPKALDGTKRRSVIARTDSRDVIITRK